MRPELKDICDTYFREDKEEGTNKLMPLSAAIKKLVRPRMSIHFSFVHYRAYGAAYELARQFWGKDPRFTLIATGILEYGIILIFGGLIKKAIAAFYGDVYPTSSPNPILQEAFMDGRVDLENWTNLTIPLRLMAAAYNLRYIPTNSIYGTSMEEENRHAYHVVEDPCGSDRKVGLLSPLQPDLTFIHGWCADVNGNTILLPPYGENVWGAYASKEGVLVTVEQIVSTDFIRSYSHLVKVPSHLVKSVSIVPFGAHPNGMFNQGLPEVEAYGEDFQFRSDFRKASRDTNEFRNWVNYWVLECKDQEEYLKRLGYNKLMSLKGEAGRNSWMYEIRSKSDNISSGKKYTPSELMAITTSRIIQEKAIEKKYKNILSGAGIAYLASALVYYWLKRNKHKDVDLMVESGFYGYAPRPGNPFIFYIANIHTNKIQSNFVEILNLFVGGNNNQCLGVIAAAEVDKFGNLNSTRLEDGRYLVGSGGANDIASGATEVVVVLKQSKKRFVEKLPYITCKGDRISTLVSDLGVFEKFNNTGEFILSKCLPNEKFSSLPEKIQNIKEHCGWDLKVSKDIREIDHPTLAIEELQVIRLLDPEGYIISS